MPEFKVSPELKEKVMAEAVDFHEVSDGKTDYIHFHLGQLPSKSALEILLQSMKETMDQAWDLFKNEEDISKLLDIVGTALYTLNLTYDVNMKTLRQWHSNLKKHDNLPSETVDKMAEDINTTLSELLGRPVDIETLSTEEIDALVAEVVEKGLGEAINDLSVRLDRTAEQN